MHVTLEGVRAFVVVSDGLQLSEHLTRMWVGVDSCQR
jgi:hypothetical protein